MREEITGIILAGGRSRRFEEDKSKILLAGVPMLEWVRRGLERHCVEVILVVARGGRHPDSDLEVWEDLVAGKGVIGGILTGLEKAKTPWIFAAGCDLPFLRQEMADLLLRSRKGGDVVVPRTDRGYEPLRAIYNKKCLPAIRRRVEQDDLKVDHFFGDVKTREIPEDQLRMADPDLISFFNINLKDDLDRAETLIREGQAIP